MQTAVPTSVDYSSSCVIAHGMDIGYQGEVVVPDVNFELTCGQSLALVGINGSGKSTLLKTIVGLLPPIKGEITVLGNPPGKNPHQLAYLSQFHDSSFILPLRVKDVVEMGRYTERGLFGRMTPEDRTIITKSIERMGILDLQDAPLRLLSGGQQQRAYMAQVLARQADLIVLDEPTSSLDASGRELFSRILDEERDRGAMIVVATHDIQLASECNQAMLLAHEVVAVGPGTEILTPEALLKTFGIVLLYQGEDKGVGIVEREHGHN
ncbi:MAG: metal ABC transporter ATP-binding protein [Anaerolineales bacterium]|nr:ABC transporter ATP-binding protein [Anaerolineae bacterium]PWB55732.1 MAG: metal ABC transporter ATP-binding protein [Anaerolineales bacterium]